MVTIWAALSLLILCTKAAKDVDLPEPVGPVTKTNPLDIQQTFEQLAVNLSCSQIEFHLELSLNARQLNYPVHERHLHENALNHQRQN
jgi:hypothetical protein